MKLQKNQEDVLGAIRAAKKVYDAQILSLEADYIRSKEAAKNPLRDLVGKAEAAGAPKRQIHLAFGFAQVGSLLSWLKPAAKSVFYTDQVNSGGSAAPLTLIQPEIEFRYHAQMVYWFEDGVEKKISRQIMGNAQDGRAVFKLNTYDFPKQNPAVQEGLLSLEGAINLNTEDEVTEYFASGALPVRYQL